MQGTQAADFAILLKSTGARWGSDGLAHRVIEES